MKKKSLKISKQTEHNIATANGDVVGRDHDKESTREKTARISRGLAVKTNLVSGGGKGH